MKNGKIPPSPRCVANRVRNTVLTANPRPIAPPTQTTGPGQCRTSSRQAATGSGSAAGGLWWRVSQRVKSKYAAAHAALAPNSTA